MSIRKITFFLCICIFINISGFLHGDRLTETSWSYYFKKGILQYKAKMYNYAIMNFEKALEKNPANFSSANLLGNIYFDKKNYQKALEYYLLSISITNDQYHIHFKLGNLYENYFYDNTRALYHYSISIKNDPENVHGLLAMARIYYHQGKLEKYNYYYKKSHSLSLKSGKQLYNNALKAQKSGNIHEAITLLKKAQKTSPAMPEIYISLFNLYRQKNDYNNAVKIMEKLKHNKPDHTTAYLYCAEIYFNRKLPGKSRKYYIFRAIKNLKQTLALDPDNYEALLLLSRIYYMTGQTIKARKLEKKTLEPEQKSVPKQY